MLLALLQLADSALPIGGASHSFGLEALVEEEYLRVDALHDFFFHFLSESGRLDAVFLRRGWRGEDCVTLSRELSARRPAREAREASIKMGRRFVDLYRNLTGMELPTGVHYPIAFGAGCAGLGIPEESAALSYLQQSLMGLVSACQRLMPLGQHAASRLIWNLRAAVEAAARDSERLDSTCFSPLPELASMRHASIESRLFIS